MRVTTGVVAGAGVRTRPASGSGAICLALVLAAAPLAAQRDPYAVLPERPTVATHAWTVAPGWFELETGIEWDRNPDGGRAFSTPSLLKIGVARRLQLGLQAGLIKPPGANAGVTDFALLLKYRLTDNAPLLGGFAVLPGVKLPLGTGPRGTGTTDFSLLLISSHQLGAIGLDVNLGYTRRSGNGQDAPRNATLWTVSAGAPVRRALGLAAEVFGMPGTLGRAGNSPTVALLAGPTIAVQTRLVIDAGVIRRIRGPQANAVYAGLVCNLGRLFPIGSG